MINIYSKKITIRILVIFLKVNLNLTGNFALYNQLYESLIILMLVYIRLL